MGYKYLGDYDNALLFQQKALQQALQIGDEGIVAVEYNRIGIIYKRFGLYSTALTYYFKALAIREKSSNEKNIANLYNNIGNIYRRKGDLDMALEYYLKTLKIRKGDKDKEGYAYVLNNIGNLYADLKIYDKALDYHKQSLKEKEELGNRHGIVSSYKNIGEVYLNTDQPEKALEYFEICLRMSREINDMEGIAQGLSDIGRAYMKFQNFSLAAKYFQESIEITENIGDKTGIINLYIHFSNLYIQLNNYNEALNFLNKSLVLAKEENLLEEISMIYFNYSTVYSEVKQPIKALEFYKKYTDVHNSIFNSEKNIKIADIQTKYEVEKKEIEIELQKTALAKKDAILKQKNTQRNALITGIVLLLILIVIVFKAFMQRKKSNLILKHQKEKIEEQNRNITDSIVYAQRIQRALLPPGDYMKQLLPHRFILYKPRDIVSGDFYWVNKKDDLIITAAADCTGHGVPGAMMSMLGVSILNEIVSIRQNEDAGEILNKFRSKLIESLHQGGKESHMWDGIDIALCLIDLKKKNVQYAGAYSPLYLIREGKLKETKGDKMPIGIHARMEPFTNHNIKIQTGDSLYIFSDGYIDQFGGENDKRFTQRRFRKLLVDIYDKPMTDQKEILEKTLTEWQGKSDQIDDILVMGVRV